MSPTYMTWLNMRQRCSNPAKPKFATYGALGVKVDPRWEDFSVFLSDMGERPSGKTLDRWPDKHGNYGPTNCRWATPQEQAENTTLTTFVNYRGAQVSMSELFRITGITKTTLRHRIKVGWSEADWARPADRSHRVRQTA